ncbi:YphA family membrane protein [Bacillus niameyensis]|uniref:YphA family membrane protein n=1 Tax=Bacillus niameyensis TaxID=1522308 RepID=UPI000786628B|nr:hypothetical protein [Bacillus niameyensis]
MAGNLFFLFMWCLWIYFTFMMNKNNNIRWKAAASILIIIIFVPVKMDVGPLTLSGPALFLLFACYYMAAKFTLKKQIYLLFSVIALMLGYTGFLLMELYDPIWVIIDRRIILSFVLFVVGYFIYPTSIRLRLLFILLGVIQGEIVFAIILSKWQISYIIGALESFDFLAIVTFSNIVQQFFASFQSHIKLQKGKKALY